MNKSAAKGVPNSKTGIFATIYPVGQKLAKSPSEKVFKEDLEMLVLSRKEGEKLVIGDNITLVVSKISGNRVTLGIEAPADVKIFRGELPASTAHQPRVVPMRRAATVTIDLDQLGEIELEKHAV